MTTATNSAQSDLVLRLTGGPRDGELVQVDTPKCLLGYSNGTSHTPHCAIFRGANGASVRSYSGNVLVNGFSSSVHWLKDGDRIEFPNSTSVEVNQIGSMGTETTVECAPETNEQFDTSYPTASAPSGTIYELEVPEPQPLNPSINVNDERFERLESQIVSLQTQQAESGERFSRIDSSLGVLCEQMTRLIEISTNNAAAAVAPVLVTESNVTPVTEQPAVEAVVETAPAETAVVESIPAEVIQAPVDDLAPCEWESTFSEQTESVEPKQDEEVFVTGGLDVPQEETFVAEIPTQENTVLPVAKFESDNEETIVSYESTNESVASEPGNLTSLVQANSANQTEPANQTEATEELKGTNEEEIAARLADMERIFGGMTEADNAASEPAQVVPVQQPIVEQYLPQIPAEPVAEQAFSHEPIQQAETESQEVPHVAESPVVEKVSDVEVAYGQEVPYVEAAPQVVDQQALQSAENEFSPEQANLESRLESLMSQMNPGKDAQPHTPANVQANESFDDLTHSQNEAEAFAGNPSEAQPFDANGQSASLPEPGSLASQLLQEVAAEESQAQEAVVEEVAAEPESAKAESEGSSLQDVLARMKESGQWDGVPDENEPFEAPAPTPEPVEAPVVEDVQPSGENDDVEDYMSQLLTRMRGGKPAPEVVPEKKEEKIETQEAAKFVPPMDPLKAEDFKPKRVAQKPKSFDAMREIANSQSRTNVSRSNEERRKALVAVQIGIAIGSFVLSGYYFLVDSSKLFDMPFLIGLLCLGVCGVFCFRSYSTMKSNEATSSKVQVTRRELPTANPEPESLA